MTNPLGHANMKFPPLSRYTLTSNNSHGYRAGRYNFPNDEAEADREDMKHHATCLLLDGKLQFAIFETDPRTALDLGTGTGIWAMQFADEHPNCSVIAVDISPIQPTEVPLNLEFQLADIEDEWTFQPESFDYIHVRYMAPAVRNWPKLLRRCKQYGIPF